jgi:hypothetical protein
MMLIDAAAREWSFVSLTDAPRILMVIADKHDERYLRAAVRWAERAHEAEVPIAKMWPLLDRCPPIRRRSRSDWGACFRTAKAHGLRSAN